MVKGKVKVGVLFGWHRAFDVDHDEKITRVIYYPDTKTELHIIPNAETVVKLHAIRDEILTIMNRNVTIEGKVIRLRELKRILEEVVEAEKWVDA